MLLSSDLGYFLLFSQRSETLTIDARGLHNTQCEWLLGEEKLQIFWDVSQNVLSIKAGQPQSRPRRTLKRLFTKSRNTIMSTIEFPNELVANTPFSDDFDQISGEFPDADVQIITSGGLRIPAHRSILVLDRKRSLIFCFTF